MSLDMDALIERSSMFEAAVLACFPATGVVLAVADNKHELVAAACTLCIEHGHVLRAAFALDAPSSGSALLRLQYEALLRGVWLKFASTATQVEKLATDLNVDAEKVAKNVGGYSDMLGAVMKTAPEAFTAPLAEFDQYSRHALNSFVHTGIHALHRTRHGYPAEMAMTVVRFSNGLSHLAYRLLASMSNSRRRLDRVTRLYKDFPECLPMKP